MNSNANEFLKEYGIGFKNNSVISTSYKKYFHPKETLITDGLVSHDILRKFNKESEPQFGKLTQASKKFYSSIFYLLANFVKDFL